MTDCLYTPQLADEICRRISEGESVRSICRDPGMPSEGTVRAWSREDRDGFAVRFRIARDLQLLRGASAAAPDAPAALEQWHSAAHDSFMSEAAAFSDRSPPLSSNHWEFSYSILDSRGQELDVNNLRRVLTEVNNEVEDLVRTGWSMFHYFRGGPTQPYFNTDPKSGLGDKDFLECSLLRDLQLRSLGADFWRVSADGKASLVRDYWEDAPEFASALNIAPGRVFSPNMLVQSLAEFVRHARGFAERFSEATAVFFRCEWWGLSTRIVGDPTALWRVGPSRQSRTDHRVASGSWPVGSLTSNLTEIVASLGSPVARAVDFGHVFTPQWVEGQRGRWLHR
jgi:terminase small subunit-like protein